MLTILISTYCERRSIYAVRNQHFFALVKVESNNSTLLTDVDGSI